MLAASGPIVARAQAPGGPTVTIVWAGDVHLGRGVAQGMARPGHADPFAALRPHLTSADLRVANLEGPLTTAPRVSSGYDLGGDPSRVGLLRDAGFDLLNLANNHATDNGREGLVDSLAGVRAVGIATVGAGPNRAEALAPVIIRRHGIRLAFLAYNLIPASHLATDRAAGVAGYDPVTAVAAIQAAHAQADLVLVQLHWGTEYDPAPSESQQQIARELVAAGADAVIGHHPHVVQPSEWLPRTGRRPAFVAYSLGNCLFDSVDPDAQRGMLLTTLVDRRGVVGIRALPLHTDWRGVTPLTAPSDRFAMVERLMPEPSKRRAALIAGHAPWFVPGNVDAVRQTPARTRVDRRFGSD